MMMMLMIMMMMMTLQSEDDDDHDDHDNDEYDDYDNNIKEKMTFQDEEESDALQRLLAIEGDRQGGNHPDLDFLIS